MQQPEIIPYDKNAKKHPKKQLELLARVVAEVGWRQNVEVNQKGVIVAGHGRYLAWVEFKDRYKLPDVWITDDKGMTIFGAHATTELTEEQERMWRLADNQINAMTDVDMELVVPELKLMSLEMLDLTGFSRDLILDNEDKDDVVPEAPAKPKSKLGDIYELGNHRLICGDSCKVETYEKLMEKVNADMVFTDPPYNVNYKGQGKDTKRTIENDNMDDLAFDTFLSTFFQSAATAVKAGGGWYVFHSSSTQDQFKLAMESAGLEVRAQLIWNKPTAALGWGDYRWKHEPFFYGGKKETKLTFYGDRTHATVLDFHKTEKELIAWVKREKRLELEGKATIWTMKRDKVNEYVHPTQKPVELITYALVNSSKAGDVVLDPFCGSGSTIIAAQKTDRVCFGVELDPSFVDVIVQRFVDYTGNGEIIKNGEVEQWTPATPVVKSVEEASTESGT